MAKNNGSDVSALVDLSKLSVSEIEALLKNKKEEQARVAAEKGAQYKKELEAYCLQKYGMSLASIYMAGWFGEAKTYKHPTTGQTYTYSGRGKVPDWLKGADGKPRSDLAVS